MGDLMDQYVTNEYFGSHITEIEPISSGYVTVPSEIETPMFARERVNIRGAARGIIDLAISSNIMVVAFHGNKVRRIDLTNPSEIVDTVEVSKNKEDEIYKIFLNPSANHLLVSMKSGESIYLGRNNKKPRLLTKLKNNKIECVGWNKVQNTDTCTGQILFGTRNGLIIESEIGSEEKFLSMTGERHPKVIFDVNENQEIKEPVTSIYMEKYSGKSLPRRFVVFVVTYSRFYQFVGDIASEAPVFQTILTVFQPNPAPYLELHSTLGYSKFSLFYPRGKGPPKYFAWLTGNGVYFGMLDFSRSDEKTENITTNTRILPSSEEKLEVPVDIYVTDFHCILLYENKFESVCTINDEEDFVETIPSINGTMIGLRSDLVKKTLWVFSETQIFQYRINNESRDVWKLYLDRSEFDLAKEYCRHNDAQMDLVWRKQAESLFNDQEYEKAAQCYALSQVSFEEVVLKFLQVKDTEALKMYLLKKLVDLKANDNTQYMMIVTWLIELYLNQLGELRDKGEKGKEEYRIIEEDFRKFLNQSRVQSCLEQNKHVAYDLLSSHADTENLIFFAMLMKDYPRVIRHHIQQDDFHAALDVLKKQKEDYQPLFEQFSPTLMQHIPGELVQLWKVRDLTPKNLIPALVTLTEQNDPNNLKYAVDYLEHCVDELKVKEPAIHNYLISLYCKMEDEQPLLKYLNRHGQDATEVCYDLKYALRLCSENKKSKAAVKIYCAMELYEEAVELALKEVDIDTAKLYAEKPEFDDALKKKLWCKVARHVVESKGDIKRAMELLKECPLLKIEDILRFFPDFATIDHFKDAICESLQEYNRHIDDLKYAMQEATDSAEVVRAEIHDIRNRYGTIGSQDKCDVCSYPIITRSFYYFPCSHIFHSDCLIAEILFMSEIEFEDMLKRRAANRPDSYYRKLLRKLNLARKTDTSSGVAIIDITDEDAVTEIPEKRKFVDLQEIEDNDEPDSKRMCNLIVKPSLFSTSGQQFPYDGHDLQKDVRSDSVVGGNSASDAIVIDDDDFDDDAKILDKKDDDNKVNGELSDNVVSMGDEIEDDLDGSDSLNSEVRKSMKDKQRLKLEDIQTKLSSVSLVPATGSGSTLSSNQNSREQLQERLDDIIAAECLLCGDMMIRSLDELFIPDSEFEQSIESWR